MPHGGTETDSGDLAAWIYLYLVTRFVMAILQLITRLVFLYPARLNARAAGQFGETQRLDWFYDHLVKCNFAIIGCLVLSGIFIQEMTSCRNQANDPASTVYTDAIRSLEIASMVTLTYVLLLRSIAAYANKTRIWFRLAWPNDPLGAESSSVPVTTSNQSPANPSPSQPSVQGPTYTSLSQTDQTIVVPTISQ